MMNHPSLFTRGALVLVASFSLLAACNSSPTSTPTAIAPTVVMPASPNPQEIPLPTLLPTVEIITSPIPVTVTPLVTEIPSVTPMTTTPVVAATTAPTRPPATEPPALTATPLPEGMPKVLVSAIRVDPPTPNPNTPGNFFVTFQNLTNENQGYRWIVEIRTADDDKRFGETAPQNSTMPPGETTLISTGWAPRGMGECRSFRGKPVVLDEDDNRSDFVQANGMPLWLDFSVCP